MENISGKFYESCHGIVISSPKRDLFGTICNMKNYTSVWQTKCQCIYWGSKLIVVVHLIKNSGCSNSFSSIATEFNEKQHNTSHITGLTICSIDLLCLLYCCLHERTAKHLSDVSAFWLLSSMNMAIKESLTNITTWLDIYSLLNLFLIKY